MVFSKRIVVDETFSENVRKLYPTKSFREGTKTLNKILEELLYGNGQKKNKK